MPANKNSNKIGLKRRDHDFNKHWVCSKLDKNIKLDPFDWFLIKVYTEVNMSFRYFISVKLYYQDKSYLLSYRYFRNIVTEWS